MKSSDYRFQVIRETQEANDNLLNVSMLCDIAGVSRSGYYRWIKAKDVREARERQDREDFDLVLKAYNQRGYSKGARGIYMCMLHWKPAVVMNLKLKSPTCNFHIKSLKLAVLDAKISLKVA